MSAADTSPNTGPVDDRGDVSASDLARRDVPEGLKQWLHCCNGSHTWVTFEQEDSVEAWTYCLWCGETP